MAQPTAVKTPLLRIGGLTKTYPRPESGGSFTVLDGVDLEIREHEIVALLGRSGSGKSTLLRSIAGLIKPSSGFVESGGKRVTGPNPDVAMVFQSFALLPWLTVVENIEVGLEAQKVDSKESRRRANEALKMVGLDGFENAYPRELSGGMQQRVGFARAFVVRPRVLLLDEPFSALDVLTAENLRGEIGDLWEDGNFPAESVVLVTHNIEEAIMLADRVVILSSNPGKVRGEIPIHLARPRERNTADFRAMADHIYTIMTRPETTVGPVYTGDSALDTSPLPHARPGAISGLLEMIQEYGGTNDVAVISERLRIEADDLLPILDAAVLLQMATVQHGDASVTEVGLSFANAEVDEAKEIFRKQVLECAPLVRTMFESLSQSRNGRLRDDFFLDVLDESYSAEEAQEQFKTAVTWGRYAGLFDYDSDEHELRLAEEDTSSE